MNHSNFVVSTRLIALCNVVFFAAAGRELVAATKEMSV
jgi:hypothetical protein